MPKRPSVPRAARTPYGPEGEPKTARSASHRVRRAAVRQDAHREEPAPAETRPAFDTTTPLLKLAGAALFGLAVGTIIHRRAAPKAPPPPRPQPRPRPAPVYHAPRPAEAQRSHIRFR